MQRNARYRTCESSPDFSVQIVTTVERCVRRMFHLDSHHNDCATTQFLSHTLRLGAHLLRISWTHSDSQKTLQTLRCGRHCVWQLMVPILRLRAPRIRM